MTARALGVFCRLAARHYRGAERLVHDPEGHRDKPGPDKIRAHATFMNHTCGGTVTL
jgi:hypothetical protein